MAADEPVIVNTILAGWREFVVAAEAEKEAMRELGLSVGYLGSESVLLGKRFNVANQAVFTARRLAYGASLALVAAGVSALRMGWSYRTAMQEASVALQPVFRGTQQLHSELGTLFNIAAFTPFQFKDITVAFRQMYGAFHPLGISVQTTNNTIRAMTDALAFVGRSSPGALNRVAVALQHMAFQGRLTGQTTLQLARDGLPVYAALTTELGLTAEQMHTIGALGIPAQTALQALTKYIETTPGYMHAAMRQATMTLHGAFTTFKDLLSQAVGSAQGGFFGGIQKFFQRVDLALAPFYRSDKPVTLTAIATAIDKVLSPRTHAFLDFFQLLNNTLKGFVLTLQDVKFTITSVMGVFPGFIGQGNSMNFIFRLGGRLLGIFLGLWLTYRVYLIAARVATVAYTTVLWLWEAAQLALLILQNAELRTEAAQWFMLKFRLIPAIITLTVGMYRYIRALIFGAPVAGRLWINMTKVEKAAIALRFRMIALAQGFAAFADSVGLSTYALLGWIGIILLVITGIVILYFKWKAFHDLVNNTARWLWQHWPLTVALLTLFLGPIGAGIVLVGTLIKYFHTLSNAIRTTVRWLTHFWNMIPGHGFFGKLVGGAAHILTAPFAGLQGGGTVTHSGAFMVGEAGPEMLLLPRGAAVAPHHDFRQMQQSGLPKYIQVHTHIYLDKQKIAKAVTKAKLDAQARE